jgi:DNA-binding XRE family transcriptional regulator
MYDFLAGAIVTYGLNKEKFAGILGITPVTMSKKINGVTGWSLEEAKKAVDYFNSRGANLTIDQLFFTSMSA